jgi:septal ring factor EnvC (AmiA/AmiB activator)
LNKIKENEKLISTEQEKHNKLLNEKEDEIKKLKKNISEKEKEEKKYEE